MAGTPPPTDGLRALADGYVAANRLPEAKKTVAIVLKLAPNDVGTHVVAGRLALAEGRADDAIKEGETASKHSDNQLPGGLPSIITWSTMRLLPAAASAATE